MTILGFSKRHGSNHSCFCRVMGCSQSGAKQEGLEGMSGFRDGKTSRDCRCWDAESWSSPQNTWKCLALHVIRMIGWLEWFLPNEWMSENDVGLFVLPSHPCFARGWEPDLNMWQAVSAQGHNYKAPLAGGWGVARPKIVNIPSFHLPWKCQGFPCDHHPCCPLFWPWFPVRKRPPGQFPSLGATWVKGHYQAGWCWGEFRFDIMGDGTYSKHHAAY